MPNTASEKQITFINSLKAERDITGVEPVQALEIARALWKAGQFSPKAASLVIDTLKAAPKRNLGAELAAAKTTPVREVTAGIYQAGDRLFRVYKGQQSGAMLVKEVLGHEGHVEYTYLGSAARVLPADAVRLSVEEVGALGKTFDHCLICGRRLDDPESVDVGVGPVCRSRY